MPCRSGGPVGINRDPEAWARLGQAIRSERERQRMTQAELAQHASVSTKALQEAEAGKVPRARKPYTLTAIEETLGWPPGRVDLILAGETAQGAGRRLARFGATPDEELEREAASAISGAMVHATDNVTASEIREATRLAIEELRRRGLLPKSADLTRNESDRNAS